MNDEQQAQHDQLMTTITNLNAQTAKFVEGASKYRAEARFEWVKVVAYVVATFSAAFYLAFKVAGLI